MLTALTCSGTVLGSPVGDAGGCLIGGPQLYPASSCHFFRGHSTILRFHRPSVCDSHQHSFFEAHLIYSVLLVSEVESSNASVAYSTQPSFHQACFFLQDSDRASLCMWRGHCCPSASRPGWSGEQPVPHTQLWHPFGSRKGWRAPSEYNSPLYDQSPSIPLDPQVPSREAKS